MSREQENDPLINCLVGAACGLVTAVVIEQGKSFLAQQMGSEVASEVFARYREPLILYGVAFGGYVGWHARKIRSFIQKELLDEDTPDSRSTSTS